LPSGPGLPSKLPTGMPSRVPTNLPSSLPGKLPTNTPTGWPSGWPVDPENPSDPVRGPQGSVSASGSFAVNGH
ncbi:MAG: hypothetical protein ACJ786_23460, partial [Catenulispora sp.]